MDLQSTTGAEISLVKILSLSFFNINLAWEKLFDNNKVIPNTGVKYSTLLEQFMNTLAQIKEITAQLFG